MSCSHPDHMNVVDWDVLLMNENFDQLCLLHKLIGNCVTSFSYLSVLLSSVICREAIFCAKDKVISCVSVFICGEAFWQIWYTTVRDVCVPDKLKCSVFII